MFAATTPPAMRAFDGVGRLIRPAIARAERPKLSSTRMGLPVKVCKAAQVSLPPALALVPLPVVQIMSQLVPRAAMAVFISPIYEFKLRTC